MRPHAARVLQRERGDAALLATDGVFSMDGDIAPLPRAGAARRARSDAWLLVDDAHGLGVLGASGRGTLDAAGLDATTCRCWSARWARPSAASAPSSPATRDLIELLLQHARSYIYTTALPPAVAAAARAALRLAAAEGWRRERLHGS